MRHLVNSRGEGASYALRVHKELAHGSREEVRVRERSTNVVGMGSKGVSLTVGLSRGRQLG